MQYARMILAGFYVLISVFSFLALGGCGRCWLRQRNFEDRGDRGGQWVMGDEKQNKKVDVGITGKNEENQCENQ